MKSTTRLLVALLSLMVAGCGIYNPVCVDIPLVHEQGELQIEGAVIPLDVDEVVPRIAIAYGITDHLTAAANLDPFRGYTQAMAGAYFPMGEKFVWEVYGGYGFGGGECRDHATSHSGKYGVTFVQIDGGWRNLTRLLNLDIAFSLKTGWLHNSLNICDGLVYYQDSFGVEHPYLAHHNAIDNSLLMEPTIELRFGWPDFKFNVKAGYCHLFGNQYGLYGELAWGLGMSYRFKTNKKTKQPAL